MSEFFKRRYNLSRSIQWPRILDPRTYIAILFSFRETNVLNYQPEIEINPGEDIIREAEETQKAFRRKKWQEDGYIPELFGFFTCKEHFEGSLPTGIYIFVNKLKYHPVKDINIAFLTVYYHELTHLVVHNVASHLPLESNYIQNFEEPFCEYVSYHLTFTKFNERPTRNLRILNRDVSIKALPKTFFMLGNYEYYVSIIGGAKNIFLNSPRPYPYKWFNEFNKIANIVSVKFKYLISACLNGTLMDVKRIEKPCDKAKVYLINVKDISLITEEKLEEILKDFYFSILLNDCFKSLEV